MLMLMGELGFRLGKVENVGVEGIAMAGAGPKLGNAGPPPEIIFRGPLKYFSWMVLQKSEPRRGDAKLGGSGGMLPPKKFCGI